MASGRWICWRTWDGWAATPGWRTAFISTAAKSSVWGAQAWGLRTVRVRTCVWVPASRRHRRDAGTQTHVRTRTVRNPHACAPQTLDFAAVEINAVRQPGVAAQPSHVLQQIQRPLAIPAQAVRIFIARLGQVGMQPHPAACLLYTSDSADEQRG